MSRRSYFHYIANGLDEDSENITPPPPPQPPLLLETDSPEDIHQLKSLKAFLDSRNSSKLPKTGFSLSNLHRAVKVGIYEIAQQLDVELEESINMAGDKRHNISLNSDDFFRYRTVDVDAIYLDGLDELEKLDEEECRQLLEWCREEIAWERNEIRRLDMHCSNARNQIITGERSAFSYRPLSRAEFLGKDLQTVQIPQRGKGENENIMMDEDEEMLDVRLDEKLREGIVRLTDYADMSGR